MAANRSTDDEAQQDVPQDGQGQQVSMLLRIAWGWNIACMISMLLIISSACSAPCSVCNKSQQAKSRPTCKVEHGLVALIAIRPLEVMSVDHSHVTIREHTPLQMRGNGHELPQGPEGLPSTVLEAHGQVHVPALKRSVHLLHGGPAWNHRIPARMHQDVLLAKYRTLKKPNIHPTGSSNADERSHMPGGPDSAASEMRQQFIRQSTLAS